MSNRICGCPAELGCVDDVCHRPTVLAITKATARQEAVDFLADRVPWCQVFDSTGTHEMHDGIHVYFGESVTAVQRSAHLGDTLVFRNGKVEVE